MVKSVGKIPLSPFPLPCSTPLSQVPLFVLAPMTAIYVTLFLTGVVGNVAVCVVIIRNRSMHTATNYYLFSLAVSDLVILLLGEFPIVFPYEREFDGVRRAGVLREEEELLLMLPLLRDGSAVFIF